MEGNSIYRITLGVVSHRKGKDLHFVTNTVWEALNYLNGWKKAQAGGTPTLLDAQTATGYNDRGELLCAFIRHYPAAHEAIGTSHAA